MSIKNTVIALACLSNLEQGKAQDDQFDENFEDQYDLSAFTIDADGNQLGDESGAKQVQEIFQEAHQCLGTLLTKYEIKDEAMSFMSFMSTPEWVETAEFADKEQFNTELGNALDPLAQKIIHAPGTEVVKSMPYEMSEWIRDSTSLWIKNKGAGSSTTEEEIQSSNRNDEMNKLKEYYEAKIAALEKEAQEKDAKILNLYNSMQSKSEDHNSLMDLMSSTHDEQTEDLQSRLELNHAEAIDKVKKELGVEHDVQIDELTETLEKECEDSLKAFKKNMTKEYQKGVKDLQKYLTKSCATNAAKLKVQTQVEMQRLQDELDELKEEYEILNERHTGLQDNNDELKKRHDKLSKGIEDLQSELDERNKQYEKLRLRDCNQLLEPELEEPEQPSFMQEEEEMVEEIEQPLEEDTQEPEVEVVEEEAEPKATGEKKSWGGRGTFSKGSAFRVENKAFIKNQLEKEDYVNRDADYYHGGSHYYNSDYNSYYTPVTKRKSKEDRSFNSFTCSAFDYECTPCDADHQHEAAACDKHQFCFMKGEKAQCHTCAKFGKHCEECNLTDGCTDCGEDHWAVGGVCFKSLW